MSKQKGHKRKFVEDNDETSEEDVSFEKNESSEPTRTSKRQKTKNSPSQPSIENSKDILTKYEDDLYDHLSEQEELDVGNNGENSSSFNVRTNFDAGQIIKVEMKDFMCHRRFTVELGRRLNFIVGKNGSGKSAIATALQLCLGATARSTGRGSALSTFIREGSNGPAIVRVSLVNEGADAYMPEVYGKKIIVERRIAKGTGSGGYHIYNEKDQEVTTRKEDLEKILRCFNIYVDNPCCVLTQEESKKFVHGKDTDKYEFFLKATGLYNLKEDLMKIKLDLEQALKAKQLEESKLQTKQQSVNDLLNKIKQFEKIEEMEKQIKISTAKIYWTDFRNEFDKWATKQDLVEKLTSEKESAERAYDKASKTQHLQEDETLRLQEQVEELERQQEQLTQQLADRNRVYREAAAVLHQLTTQEANHRNQQKDEERRIKDIDFELKQKRDIMMRTANADQRQKAEKIEKLEQLMENLRHQEKDLRDKVQEASQHLQRLNEEKQQARHVMDAAEETIRRTTEHIQSIRSSSNNRAAAIADYMPRLLQQMGEVRFEEEVAGPIGARVTMKEGYERDWGRAVERALGPYLRSFVTTNLRDRNLISNLQQKSDRSRGVPVYTQHRSSRYQVESMPSGVLTVADVVNIPDDIVFNCLVDQLSIDRIILARDENEVLQRYVVQRNGRDALDFDATSVITADGTLIRYIYGNQSSEVSRYPFRNILNADTTAMVEAAIRTKEAKEMEAVDARRHFEQMNQQIGASLKALSQFKQSVSETTKEIQTYQRQKEAIQDELQDINAINSMDLSPLELEKEDHLRVIQHVQSNLKQIEIDIQQANAEVNQAKKLKEEIDRSKAKILQGIQKLSEKITSTINDREQAKRRIEVMKHRYEEKKQQLQQEEEQLNQLNEFIDTKRQDAIQQTSALLGDDSEEWGFNPDKLSPKETRLSLEKQIKQYKADIIEYKKEIGLKGYTMEILQERYNRAQDEYELLSSTIMKLNENYTLIENDQKQREQKWLNALKSSTNIMKRKFDHYVQKKGSSGTIKFNHRDKKLELAFQVDNNDVESKANDIRNLSGGERSFVTFSVLLALGHVIEAPFRLMDEYDVFMDNITRRLTLEALQTYAKSADQSNRQFIVITPHEVSAVTTGPSVKVISMPEPQRMSAHGLQQQTLN